MEKLLQWKWYIVLATAYVLAVIARFEVLADVLKMQLVPMVFWLHYREKKKIHLFSWIILLSYFFGDILWSVRNPEVFPYMMLVFMVGHLMFVYISYRCIKDLNVKKILFSALPFIILWFIYFVFSIWDIFGDKMGDQYPFIMAYALVVCTFFILTMIKFFNDERKVYMFTLIIALTLVGGDIMFGLYSYLAPLFVFYLTHALATAVHYFFILRFFNDFDFAEITGKKDSVPS